MNLIVKSPLIWVILLPLVFACQAKDNRNDVESIAVVEDRSDSTSYDLEWWGPLIHIAQDPPIALKEVRNMGTLAGYLCHGTHEYITILLHNNEVLHLYYCDGQLILIEFGEYNWPLFDHPFFQFHVSVERSFSYDSKFSLWGKTRSNQTHASLQFNTGAHLSYYGHQVYFDDNNELYFIASNESASLNRDSLLVFYSPSDARWYLDSEEK